MPPSPPIVGASLLTGLRGFLAKRGASLDVLLREAGLERQEVEDPRQALPMNAVADLLDRAARRTGDPCLGLHYATALPLGASGLLGHIVLTAPTVRDALIAIIDYAELSLAPMRFVLDERDGIGSFWWRYPATFSAPRIQFTSFVFAGLVLRLRLGTGPEWRPLSADFDHREPDDCDEYREYFGTRLSFDQPQNGLRIDASSLAKAMPPALPGLFESVRELGDRVLADSRRPGDLPLAVRKEIADRLGCDAGFDLEAIAEALHLSARSLQWKLEQAGTSYERLLTETRMQRAELLLRDTGLALTEIAHALGFSELSAFTRAAHRWFGMAPSAYRQRLRRQPGQQAARPPLRRPAAARRRKGHGARG